MRQSRSFLSRVLASLLSILIRHLSVVINTSQFLPSSPFFKRIAWKYPIKTKDREENSANKQRKGRGKRALLICLNQILMEFKQKMRTSNCFSCCFGTSGSSDDLIEERPISLMRTSSTWLKERAQELPELGERWRGIVERVRWRRRFTGEFSYDPLSYARNFDGGMDEIEGDDSAQGDAFRYKDFSSRLPPLPSTRPAVAIS